MPEGTTRRFPQGRKPQGEYAPKAAGSHFLMRRRFFSKLNEYATNIHRHRIFLNGACWAVKANAFMTGAFYAARPGEAEAG